jgi:radical SAM family uncharacterized protein
MEEDILLQVRKPGRYIGEEWNVSRKDFDAAKIRFALCFPDLYEVGMSNLGVRIIYGLLNRLPEVCCERFFSPAQDMEAVIRQGRGAMASLENKRKLRDFDLIGFSLGYELHYTNALNILDLGGIPLFASERDRQYPLVIAGGPSTLNPEPMREFIDAFVIGEGEEAVREIVDTYRGLHDRFKAGGVSKADLLKELSRIAGVYVPALYEEGAHKIEKRFIKDFNSSYFPAEWLVPYIEIIHDRITLELMRGCPHQCRFCQARLQYYPCRKRESETIMKLAQDAYRHTGYDEISLAGLSVSDYPGIETLVKQLIDAFKEKCVSVSFPSLKPKVLVGNLSSLVASIRKTGLTFAPEAGTERMRRVLNKDFESESFFTALEAAYRAGYQRVKLYFMIGIPGETEEDLDGIIDFANRASALRKKAGFSPARVSLSVNALIPKPHTPFQWFPMDGLSSIAQKQSYLRKKTVNRNIQLTFHNRQMSFIEGVLARGDRRLSRVLLTVFKQGGRFDAWEDSFVFERWMDAFKEAGVDPEAYVSSRSTGELLPWDFIDVGMEKRLLLEEYNDSRGQVSGASPYLKDVAAT